MKLKPLIATVALAGLSQTGMAAETTALQKRSALTGFVVGAAAGGPIGAFAGTVMGGEVFGRLFEQRRTNRELKIEISKLQARLTKEQASSTALIAELNGDLDKVLSLQTNAKKSQHLPVQFRTGSSEVESQYEAELENIARVLRQNQDARVNLTGYADRRGDESYNQSLSEARVDAVEQFLISRGAAGNQILSMAYGETQPLAQVETLEDNFFDRRVLLELHMDIDPQLATR